MPITITARHCEISEELKQRAQSVVDRLEVLASRSFDGTLVFDVAPTSATAELRLKGGKGEPLVATGEAKDHRSALDRAEEKIRRQLEKDTASRRGLGARDAV